MLELVLKGCEMVGGVVNATEGNAQSNDQSNAQSNSKSAELVQERVLCTLNALMIASAHHPQSKPQSNSQSNTQSIISWVDLLQEMITESEPGLGPAQGPGLALAQGQGLGSDTFSIIPQQYHGALWRDLLRLIPHAVQGCVGDTVEGGYLLQALLEGGESVGPSLLPEHVIGK